jgi:hypothetical protein
MLTAREDHVFLTREASSTGARSVLDRRRIKEEPIPIREELSPTGSSQRANTCNDNKPPKHYEA